jgi:hypothetical protein
MTRITDTVHEDQYIFLISHSVTLRMRNISESSHRETQNTHFMFCNFFWKFVPLLDNVEKYCIARQATDGSRTHVHCMLDTEG